MRRSSCPLHEFEIEWGSESDLGPILKHAPSLVTLLVQESYLRPPVMMKMVSGDWVPCLERLECRVDFGDGLQFLDVLERRWQSEATLPLGGRRLLSSGDVLISSEEADEDELHRRGIDLMKRFGPTEFIVATNEHKNIFAI